MFKNNLKKANVEKLNQISKNKKSISKKNFYLFNPTIIHNSKDYNHQKYAKYKQKEKDKIAGTVIESGFMSWRWNYLSDKIFKKSVANISYKKIIFRSTTNPTKNKHTKYLSKREKIKLYYRLTDAKSAIVFGGAGSGKTKGIVENTIFANMLSPGSPNIIVSDPKGELSNLIVPIANQFNYNCRVMNLLDSKNTDGVSPFFYVKELIYKMSKFPLKTSKLSYDIISQKFEIINDVDIELKKIIASLDTDATHESSNNFWNDQGKEAIYNLAWLLIDDLMISYKEIIGQPNFNQELEDKNKNEFKKIFVKLSFQSIFSILNNFGFSGRESYIKFYKEKYNIDILEKNSQEVITFKEEHPGTAAFESLWREDQNSTMNRDVISNATRLLRIFNSKALKNSTTYDTFSLDDFTNEDPSAKPIILFITMNTSDESTLPYISWFINYLLIRLFTFSTTEGRTSLKKPIMLILEELGNIPKIKMISKAVNEGRGKNIFCSLFFQTYAQYNNLYGKSESDLEKSCEYKIILTNTEDSHFVNNIISYTGTYKKKIENDRYIDAPRLSKNDISGIPMFKMLVLQKNFNLPYFSQVLPSFLLNIKPAKRLKISIVHPAYNVIKNVVYNPLDSAQGIHINLDFLLKDFNEEELLKISQTENQKKELLEAIDYYENFHNKKENINEEINKMKHNLNMIQVSNLLDQNEFEINEKISNFENELNTESTNNIKILMDSFSKKDSHINQTNELHNDDLKKKLSIFYSSKSNPQKAKELIGIILNSRPPLEDLSNFDRIEKNYDFLIKLMFQAKSIDEFEQISKPYIKGGFWNLINQMNKKMKNNNIKRLIHLACDYLQISNIITSKFNKELDITIFKDLKKLFVSIQDFSQIKDPNQIKELKVNNPILAHELNNISDSTLKIIPFLNMYQFGKFTKKSKQKIRWFLNNYANDLMKYTNLKKEIIDVLLI